MSSTGKKGYYEMNNEFRGYFYIKIKLKDDSLGGKLPEFKNEMKRFGFIIKDTPKHLPIDSYIAGEIAEEKRFLYDDCVAMLYCCPEEEKYKELDIMNLFHIEDPGHSLYGKPKILIVIYQTLRLYETDEQVQSFLETDCEPEYIRPKESDILHISMGVYNVPSAIKKLCDQLKTIKKQTDAEDFFMSLANNMKPIVVNRHTTLSEYLSIGPKKIDNNALQKRQNNEKLLTSCTKVFEMEANNKINKELLQLKKKYNFEEFNEQIRDDPMCEIPNIKTIIKDTSILN